jgi:hypothetical protein
MSNFLLLAGLYAVAFLSVAMGALLSADTLAGEISSGTIQTIVTKPLRRSDVVLGQMAGIRRPAGALPPVDVRWDGIKCLPPIRISAAKFAGGSVADLPGGPARDDLLPGVFQRHAGPGNGRDGLRTVRSRVHWRLDRANRRDIQQSDGCPGGHCHQPVVPHRGHLAQGYL